MTSEVFLICLCVLLLSNAFDVPSNRLIKPSYTRCFAKRTRGSIRVKDDELAELERRLNPAEKLKLRDFRKMSIEELERQLAIETGIGLKRFLGKDGKLLTKTDQIMADKSRFPGFEPDTPPKTPEEPVHRKPQIVQKPYRARKSSSKQDAKVSSGDDDTEDDEYDEDDDYDDIEVTRSDENDEEFDQEEIYDDDDDGDDDDDYYESSKSGGKKGNERTVEKRRKTKELIPDTEEDKEEVETPSAAAKQEVYKKMLADYTQRSALAIRSKKKSDGDDKPNEKKNTKETSKKNNNEDKEVEEPKKSLKSKTSKPSYVFEKPGELDFYTSDDPPSPSTAAIENSGHSSTKQKVSSADRTTEKPSIIKEQKKVLAKPSTTKKSVLKNPSALGKKSSLPTIPSSPDEPITKKMTKSRK